MVWPKRSIASLNVSAIGIGGAHWSLWSDHNDEQSIQVINAAIDAGVNFIDTAFRYTPVGKDQHNELLVARALKERGWKSQVEPSEIVVATKGGHFGYGEEGFVDGRPETIERHLEASLRALEVEQIQLYYLHWPDPNVPIGESIEAQTGLGNHVAIAIEEQIAFDMAAAKRKEGHDLFVPIDFTEQITVFVPPIAKGEPVCLYDDHGYGLSPGDEIGLAIALEIEEGGEVAVVDTDLGFRGNGGLGVQCNA